MPESGHYIMFDEPELVIDEIIKIRSWRQPPKMPPEHSFR